MFPIWKWHVLIWLDIYWVTQFQSCCLGKHIAFFVGIKSSKTAYL
ncbi:Tyrosyl-DNA phosphodiesterase [Musa troglodytarum]|uniref:Tyrosyl-DNA phosphodiesterase n=1 Tax=Musa troglodytarum TaxID=320322 RepID=A0A9E7IFG7_9LILI|nr:Tyrosyl-DNA phosphodiesterase [Musa troglodytarum]